jgi:hypothetical protein
MTVLRTQRPTAGQLVRRLATDSSVLTEHLYAAGHPLSRHYHTSSFLTIVIGGSYGEEVDGKKDGCGQYGIRFLPAGELHADEYKTTCRCLHIELSSATLQSISAESSVALRPGAILRPACSYDWSTALRRVPSTR